MPHRHRERRRGPARYQAGQAIQGREFAPTDGLTLAYQLVLKNCRHARTGAIRETYLEKEQEQGAQAE